MLYSVLSQVCWVYNGCHACLMHRGMDCRTRSEALASLVP